MHLIRHIDPPLRLFSGEGSIAALKKELMRIGCNRVVILCGRSLAEGEEIQILQKVMGGRLAGICAEVRADSPVAAVNAAVSQLAELNADAIIAVGGGSAMVTARAIAIALAERRPLDQLCTRRDSQGKLQSPRLDAPKLPILAVPTTPSTAVVKPGTAVFDENSGMRLAFFDPKTRPTAIFLEPTFLNSAPSELTRDAVVNTLCSAIEGLASGTTDQIAIAMLTHAVRLCAENLDTTYDCLERRVNLATAAVLCGRGTDNTGMGLATVISHAVAKSHGVNGGVAKAVALPHVLRFNSAFVATGRAALGQTLDCKDNSIEESLQRLFAYMDLPVRFKNLGIPFNDLPEISNKCMEDWFIRTNPRPIERESEILELLRDAW